MWPKAPDLNLPRAGTLRRCGYAQRSKPGAISTASARLPGSLRGSRPAVRTGKRQMAPVSLSHFYKFFVAFRQVECRIFTGFLSSFYKFSPDANDYHVDFVQHC